MISRLKPVRLGLLSKAQLVRKLSNAPELFKVLSDPVKMTERGIEVDGREFLHVETRNMCKCEACYGRFSHQRTDLPYRGAMDFPDIKVSDIGRTSENYISLKWSDDHEGVIARNKRGNFGPDPIISRVENWFDLTCRKNSAQKFWSTPDEDVTKCWDYSWVVRNQENTIEFLTHYMKYGIGLLVDIPRHLGMMEIVEEGLKIKPLRRTCFSAVDLVRFKPNPDNVGYGSGPLNLHSDLPYFNQAPHVQFFHLLENTVIGGDSYWIDTFPILKELSEKRPDLFEILKTIPMVWRYSPPGTGIYQLSRQCVVKMQGDEIWQTVDAPQSMDPDTFARTTSLRDREMWWEAYNYYRRLVDQEDRIFSRKLNGGEFVMTDNFRVFHARRSFFKTSEEQERIVSTSYMDWNIMVSRVLSTEKGDSAFLEVREH